MAESLVLTEYQQAKEEGRQPNCPYCGQPLEVRETQYEYLTWRWSEALGRFVKHKSGDADKPYCAKCEERDWDFLDENYEDIIGF